jgi:hypothetical protein
LIDEVKEDEMGQECSTLHLKYLWEIQKERDHQEDKDMDGLIILKCILNSVRFYERNIEL